MIGRAGGASRKCSQGGETEFRRREPGFGEAGQGNLSLFSDDWIRGEVESAEAPVLDAQNSIIPIGCENEDEDEDGWG